MGRKGHITHPMVLLHLEKQHMESRSKRISIGDGLTGRGAWTPATFKRASGNACEGLVGPTNETRNQ